MIAYLNGEKLNDSSQLKSDAQNLLCIAHKQEESSILSDLFPARARQDDKTSAANYFESRAGFDYIHIKIPDIGLPTNSGAIEIYFSPQKLAFLFNKTEMMEAFTRDLEDNSDRLASLESVLYHFLVKLTGDDAQSLEQIELEIVKMEDTLLSHADEDYYASISAMRKRLLLLKRYYESLADLYDEMEENRNGFFDDKALNLIHFQSKRVDRLYSDVLNLRDYLTQVREAYQSQADITLNKTMRFFTVVATIFLPLTLVVGWYGMNLSMPEYDQPYAYPVVIVISAVIIVASVIYFRKKKWF